LFAVEKETLRILHGLAVPDIIDLSCTELPIQIHTNTGCSGPIGTACVVESYEGDAIHEHESPSNRNAIAMVAVWIFCLEQFVAFRRRQILYTDIKCGNVLSSGRNPGRIVIVDFDHIIALSGRRRWEHFGSSRGMEPPEIGSGGKPSEASAVFQLGILLMHFLTGGDARHLLSATRGMPMALRRLREIDNTRLGRLLMRCIATNPRTRPPSFDAVFQQVMASDVDEHILEKWRSFRSPYVSALADLGL
jgi:serine/threonine protein kinase